MQWRSRPRGGGRRNGRVLGAAAEEHDEGCGAAPTPARAEEHDKGGIGLTPMMQ